MSFGFSDLIYFPFLSLLCFPLHPHLHSHPNPPINVNIGTGLTLFVWFHLFAFWFSVLEMKRRFCALTLSYNISGLWYMSWVTYISVLCAHIFKCHKCQGVLIFILHCHKFIGLWVFAFVASSISSEFCSKSHRHASCGIGALCSSRCGHTDCFQLLATLF